MTKANDPRHSAKFPSEPSAPPMGLLAGWGQLPIVVAKQLKSQGSDVFCCGIRNHADPVLIDICDDFTWVGITRFGKQIRFFRRHHVKNATMAGKVFKTQLFQKYGWLKHFPDLTFWRHFYPHFITKTKNRNDDRLLTDTINMFAHYGINFAPATDFAPEILVKKAILTRRKPSNYQLRDIQFAWKLAKETGRLDIGQSVAVKGRAVLAVEAVEGTDECIRRAGQLCPSGGFTVVKVAKPNQDMRFDVPTIGVGTLSTLRDAGGAVLAVEADKTIILAQKQMIDLANRHGISIVAVSDSQMEQEITSAA
jgi:DUF1009 family protein